MFNLSPASAVRYMSLSTERSGFLDLRCEYEHALKDGWDGDGSIALDENFLRHVFSFVDYVGQEPDSVEPGGDGSIAFKWQSGDGLYLYADFGPGNFVHLYYALRDGSTWEGILRLSDVSVFRHLSNAMNIQTRLKVATSNAVSYNPYLSAA